MPEKVNVPDEVDQLSVNDDVIADSDELIPNAVDDIAAEDVKSDEALMDQSQNIPNESDESLYKEAVNET